MQVIPVISLILPKRIVQVPSLSQISFELTIPADFVATRPQLIITEWIQNFRALNVSAVILWAIS